MGKDCKDHIPLDAEPLTRMAPTNGITRCHRGSPSTHGAHMGREGGGGVPGRGEIPRGYTLIRRHKGSGLVWGARKNEGEARSGLTEYGEARGSHKEGPEKNCKMKQL